MSKNRLYAGIVNCFWFAVVLFLSWKMPYVGDDFGHMKSFLTGDKIVSVTQLIPSAARYYETWGGRFLSMVLIQTMLLLPKPVFNIVNAVIYVLTMNLISSYGDIVLPEKSVKLSSISVLRLNLVFFCSWFFTAQIADVVFWLTGSITYLWMTCIILIFGRLVMASNWVPGSVFFEMLIFLLGFVAGLSLEVGSCTLLIALIVYAIVSRKKANKFTQIKILWGGAGVFLGVFFLILAPGNGARSQIVSNLFESTNLIVRYGWRIARESYYSYRYLSVPLAISILLVVFDIYLQENGNLLKGKWRDKIRLFVRRPETFMYILTFFSVYVMSFSSGYSNRVLQFPLILILVAISISFSDLAKHMHMDAIRELMMIPILILLLYVLLEIITGMIQIREYGSVFDRYTTFHQMDEAGSLLEGNGVSQIEKLQ